MSLQQFNQYPCFTPARLVATSNQSGTYNNGPLNNGVGATFTYATGALTIDSVTVNVGDSIVFVAQSAANQNGIYICTQAGATGVAAVLQRRADLQCIEQFLLGSYISVSAGTVNAGATYTLVEPKPAHFGVDNMSFNATITSGLGTAATKAASDNSKASVASVNGTTTANALAVFSDTAGTVKDQTTASTLGFGLTLATGNFAASQGNVVAGSSGHAGTVTSFPATGSKGSLKLAAVNNTGDTITTISNAAMGQASVISIPDPGVATAKFLLNNNRASAANSTITVAAGAANHCTVTVQLKDTNGNNISTVQAFQVYSSDSASGIGITATPASTGYSMTSGGGVAALTGSITENLFCVSSATGGAVIDLLDTAKTPYRIVLVLNDGIVVSAAAVYG